jgi:hypothetical protein
MLLFFLNIQSCSDHTIFAFVNHVQKFKWLANKIPYAKADCCLLNRDAEGLIQITMQKAQDLNGLPQLLMFLADNLR